MHLGIAAAAALFGVPFYDWGMVGRSASAMSFDYRYWPLSKPRTISVVILALATFAAIVFLRPPVPDDKVWHVFPLLAAIVLHGVVALHDIARQKAQSFNSENDR